MENFVIYNPTKVIFGKNAIEYIPKYLSEHNKVLLLYGQGSIKKNGIYDCVIEQLKKTNIEIFEYSGIKPNPIIEDVYEAIKVVRRNKIDCILAVGGGSVIDSAKTVAAASPYEEFDAWDLFTEKLKPKTALPIYVVLTLSATGSEMNPYAVIQNNKLKSKAAFESKHIFPKVSFLNPEYTLSVPKQYLSYGLSDITAHCLEAFFGKGESPLSDAFTIAIIKEIIEIAPDILSKREYEKHARMMYASTMALNNTTIYGKEIGDWGVHSIGHILSLEYDVPHGATLSIAYPAWLKLMANRIPDKISTLGRMLFCVNEVDKTITKVEEMFTLFNCPIRISQLNLQNFDRQKIIDLMILNKVDGYVHKLSTDDYEKLIELMY